LTLGDPKGTSLTTVYAESRRLMLERIGTESGAFATRSFTVNVRTPVISPGVSVDIDSRETNSLTWDDKLTLQFNDTKPCLCAMEITKVDDAITVFVCGDSTVTDQATGGIGTWAQFLPRWFTPAVAVANHAESGETLKAFRTERRWDKLMSQLKKGDYVLMQFGTNDSKATGSNPIYPASHPDSNFANTYSAANTDFRTLYEKYAAEVQAKGATLVVVSLGARRNMTNGKIANSFGDYPKAAATAALESKSPFIDLNGMSTDVYNALGANLVARAFNDQTHPSNYGGYVLSRCIVAGIKSDKLDLAKYLVDDTGTFDVNQPTPMPDDFKVPVEVGGGGGRAGGRGARGAAPTPPAPGN
jgi:lysophospholipase L1-like esterase